ncbi:MAG TPA: VOC family protein [Paludibacteraceae bacterium]|nr:VOC family protein [Paludibacteraceae bacterium]
MPVTLHHIGIWVDDLHKMRQFYEHYFSAHCSKKYINPITNFSSYFLSFGNDSTRIELMCRVDTTIEPTKRGIMKGYAHIALSVGSTSKVNQLTENLRNDHYKIVSEPRTTGDGYYESIVLDPEGNYIEITV